eukprot:11818268-Heterocapsa_arctica.AAC.1
MFADVSGAVNTGCFFIPADPETQPRSNSTGNMQPGMDSSAHGCSSGRPYKHTTIERPLGTRAARTEPSTRGLRSAT